MQQIKYPERVIYRLKKVFIVLNHLGAHIYTKPLFIHVEFIAIEHVCEREVTLSYQSCQVYCTLKAQRDRLEIGRANGRIADQERRGIGERVVSELFGKPLPAGCVTGPVQVQGNSYYLDITNYLSVRFLFYFVDKAVHRMSDLGKVYAKPLAVECCRHRLVVLSGDIDDARYKADVTIITGTIDRRNKFIVQVLNILVVLAILIAQVLLAVHEGSP